MLPILDRISTELSSSRHEELSVISGAESPAPRETNPIQEMPLHEGSLASPEFVQAHLGEWHPQYMNCARFFLEQGQHSLVVQSLAGFLNIRLPYQRPSDPPQEASTVSLRLYIRRLVVTAHDMPFILQAFFGDDWMAGVGSICRHECINYLFTAKSGGWASTKAVYDMLPDEHTPFLRPIYNTTEEELRTAEFGWSEWLAMEDWMVGSRSPW